MRDNSMVNVVVSKTVPSLEGSNLPVPNVELDVVSEVKNLEVADSVDELLPIEATDPVEERQELTRLLDINENDPTIDPFSATMSQEALQARIRDAMENEYDSTDNIMVTPTARPQVSWDELQSELPAVLTRSPDIEQELEELATIADVSDRVQVSLGMAKSMESATELDLSFINITLESFAKELKVDVPRLTVVDNQVSKDSLESLEQWNARLRGFVLRTYSQIRP